MRALESRQQPQESPGQEPPVPRKSLLRSLALATICALAGTIPIEYAVAFLLEADKTFRGLGTYLSIVALLLSLPFLPGARLGKRIAPILLIAGSMFAGMLSLFALRWDGYLGGPIGRLDWPFRLAVMSVLFAFAASQRAWRRRLLNSYLLGWGAFVGFGLYMLLSGRAEIVQHFDVERASIAGLDQNEQSVLVATGMVLLFDEMLSRGLVGTLILLGGLLVGMVVFASGTSRSAALALACGLTVVIVGWFRSRSARLSRQTARLALVLALLVGGAAVVMQRSVLAGDEFAGYALRVQAALAGQDLGKRDELVKRTWSIAVANPWHGVGFGRVREYLGGDSHNGYLRIFAEGGALAAILLFAGLMLAGAALLRQVRGGQRSGAAGGLVVLLIWAAAGQALVNVPFWFFLGVVVAGQEGDGA